MPIIAVNIEVKIPIDKVIENPFIGPVPNAYKTRATNRVVKLASIIVKKALSYPLSIASKGFLPFFNSSRILEKISTLASTAIPTVSTIPAIQGNVRVDVSTDMIATKRTILLVKAKLAAMPKTL